MGTLQNLLEERESYPYALVEIIRQATGDPRILEAIRPYLQSTKFKDVGRPQRFYCPIRLIAGYALASEMAAIGNFEPIVVHNTPLCIKPWEEDIIDLAYQIKDTSLATPQINNQRTLDAFEELYLQGKLRTTDLKIIPGGEYNEAFRLKRWEDLPSDASS